MPLDDKETLRFFAEKLHGKNGALQRSADALLTVLQRERLQRELEANTEALRQAEAAGDDAAAKQLSELSQQLTRAIAKASKR